MKERILVDMDGVLADVYARFFDLHEEETGIRLSVRDIAGLKEADAFPGQLRWVNSPGFFRTVPVMAGSYNILKSLNAKYDVIVISMATEFPLCLTDKQLWLMEYYPFIGWQQMVFCGNKSLLKADIMIDDHLKNLDEFEGKTIMFNQPHNLFEKDVRHRRVDIWPEIGKILL